MNAWNLDGTWTVRTSDAGRVVLFESATAPPRSLIAWHYAGPQLPGTVGDARIEVDQGCYRLAWTGGEATFTAARIDRHEAMPTLYDPLHASFQLRRRDRWVARLLLSLLRIPGGERVLRAWHTRRR